MLERCVELLAPVATSESFIIDCTLGLGGHSAALLQRLPHVTVLGIDRDPAALQRASARLAEFGSRFVPIHATYDAVAEVAANYVAESGKQCRGILFDLGVSSMQLDFVERGFAYAQDAPLDMRMDQSTGITAAELLASSSAAELTQLFKRYGDEPLASRYAAAIVAARETTPLTRSTELVEVLQEATPAKMKNLRHPAKRVFQALRVAVNDELTVLAAAIPNALQALAVGGRIVVMAYQSHEDKIVKNAFAQVSRDRTPAGLPQQLPEFAPAFKLLTRGAEQASAAEQETNPRSIPVRLRAAEKVRET